MSHTLIVTFFWVSLMGHAGGPASVETTFNDPNRCEQARADQVKQLVERGAKVLSSGCYLR